MRQCCGNKRGFVIHILDNVGQVNNLFLCMIMSTCVVTCEELYIKELAVA